MKLASFSLLQWSCAAFYALLITLPFGTRLLIAQGYLGQAPVEWGTISIYATQLLAGVVILLAGIHALRSGGRTTLLRASGIPALLLVMVAAIATTWSPDPVYAGIVTAWILLGVLLASALHVIRPDPRTSCVAFVIGATFQAAIGLWQSFMQSVAASTLLGIAPHAPGDLGAFVIETSVGRWLRSYGTLPHPNVLGAVLVVAIIATFVAAERSVKRTRTMLLMALPVLTAALFFTYSRSAWLGLVVALAVLFVGLRHRTPGVSSLKESLLLSLAIVLTTTVILTAMHREAVVTRMGVEGALEQRSIDERKGQYDEALQIFLKHPFLGVGPGQMPAVLADTDTAGRTGWEYQPVHNTSALVTVELGIVGFLLWLAVIMGALLGARPREDETESYRLAFRAILFALLVMSLFDHYLFSLWIGQLLFWMSIGTLWAFEKE